MNNLQIINQFDIEDMKNSIKELLPNLNMPFNETSTEGSFNKSNLNTGFFLDFFLGCSVILTIVLCAINMPDVDLSRQVAMAIACGIVTTLLCGIVSTIQKHRITKKNRILIEDLLNTATTLEEISQIIDIAAERFDLYKRTSYHFKHDVFSLREMQQRIRPYLAIASCPVLNIKCEKRGDSYCDVIFDLKNPDCTVKTIEIVAKIVRSTDAVETSLVFTNWDSPALVKKYEPPVV